MSSSNGFHKEQEQLFRSLLKQAEKKGFIRAATILTRFDKYHLKEGEKEELFAAFEENNVNIIFEEEPMDTSEFDAELPEYDTSNFYIPDHIAGVDSTVMDSVKLYLKQIHEFPTLSHKETLALIRRVMEGDAESREYLINCNLKFAFLIAAKFAQPNYPLLDLVQQANIGLMNAVDRYNPNRGTKFTTYSVFWIRQAIYRYIEDNSRMIRLPKYIQIDVNRIRAHREAYYKEHHSYPTDDEVATALGLSIAKVKYLSTVDISIVSTDEQPNEEMDGTYLDLIKVEDEEQDPFYGMQEGNLQKELHCFLEKLPERERKIIMMRFGLYNGTPMKLEAVGAELGLTRERIRQLESKALSLLRKMPGITALYDYLHQ